MPIYSNYLVNMSVAVTQFVQHIEEIIYTQNLVYRSILVTKNEKESRLLRQNLEGKDYSTIIIDSIQDDGSYNSIDYRIVIISHDKFKRFIEHLDRNEGGIMESTYNFIAFSYLLKDMIVEDLVSYYLQKTNNNLNDTIILEKNYANFLYFQQTCS